MPCDCSSKRNLHIYQNNVDILIYISIKFKILKSKLSYNEISSSMHYVHSNIHLCL